MIQLHERFVQSSRQQRENQVLKTHLLVEGLQWQEECFSVPEDEY